MSSFQDIVFLLSTFWAKHGCIISTPYDLEKGASTSNPDTLLRAIGPEPYAMATIEPCRRPKDGRYGENPNRVQHYFQYQVILKPSPDNIVDLYLDSLRAIGLDTTQHDIRFVHDDWENPTLGAWGLGWEVWIDGMECSQFTYFQAAAGIPLTSITGEITYGLERLAMSLQKVDTIFDIKWNDSMTYGDLFKQNEIQWSRYNFESQDDGMWMRHFQDYQAEAIRLVNEGLCIPAYDFVIKASHAFNMLDAKGVISVSERASYIGKIRELAKAVAEKYVVFREGLGFPLLKYKKTAPTPPMLPPLPYPKAPKERFVLEIGCEELPAVFVPIGIQALTQAMKRLLEKEGLGFSSLKAYGAPRRLAVVVEDLITEKPATAIEKRGPQIDLMWKNGSLTDVGTGFLKGLLIPPCSLSDVEQGKVSGLEVRSVRDQKYLFATITSPAISTAQILQNTLPTLIGSLEFPKSMRWGDHALSFARPIRWITALLGSDVVPFCLEFILSGRTSQGHRQLSPRPVDIVDAKSFERTLEEVYVLIDQNRRKEKIYAELNSLAGELTPVQKEKVVAQVLHLTEWPQVAMATFDSRLLDAPKEVLISEMVEHQKYFPLVDEKGALTNHFVIVADNNPTELVTHGNIKVLTARLSDGSFLWKEDCKTPLKQLREKLKTIVYQHDLGTMWQKTERLEVLSRSFHAFVPQANLDSTLEAARLSKADLASQVVGEFPELQGIVGSLLASVQKALPCPESIRQHWLPNQEDGELPSCPEGILLALADKFDTLTGFFAVGLKPTSSSDPYALRRQAIGLIRIILAQKIHLSLRALFAKTLTLFEASRPNLDRNAIISDLLSFVITRAKSLFVDIGFRREAVDAVLSSQSDDLYDVYLRLQALQVLQQSHKAFSSFAEVIKRCHGQVEFSFTPVIHQERLEDPAEQLLYQILEVTENQCAMAAERHDWTAFLTTLLDLREPIDKLFTSVKVLADDPILRQNRLSLLRRIIGLSSTFADVKRLAISPS